MKLSTVLLLVAAVLYVIEAATIAVQLDRGAQLGMSLVFLLVGAFAATAFYLGRRAERYVQSAVPHE